MSTVSMRQWGVNASEVGKIINLTAKRRCGESFPLGTTYVAVQHLLFIVETQTHKRVTSAVKVNELQVNMEIFQNIGDSSEFSAMSQPKIEESTNFMPTKNRQHPPLFVNISFHKQP